jgi:3-mercaptopyruvate sulfurtransferase SseA
VALSLKAEGWDKARALVGGWDAWLEAGLPVESRAAEAWKALRGEAAG